VKQDGGQYKKATFINFYQKMVELEIPSHLTKTAREVSLKLLTFNSAEFL
jgi:hypothetical protein